MLPDRGSEISLPVIDLSILAFSVFLSHGP